MSTGTLPVPAPAMPIMKAEQFLAQHGDESGVELVKGQVVRHPMPGTRHGEVCLNAAMIIGGFVKANGRGRAMLNDSFVQTTANPDSFRGADVIFLSYNRLPKDQKTPTGVCPSPDLVVEVRSPSDRLKTLSDKAYEYLDAGVSVVVLLIPESETAAVFRPDTLPVQIASDAELTLPDVLPGFSVLLRKFFE
jgi:Uma2 family endonuclease